MSKLLAIISFLFMSFSAASCSGSAGTVVDVLVVGGGTSGVAAGIQSARLGASTLIAEQTGWLGGMLTSAGVSAVDGNYNLPAGLWGEFKAGLEEYYGGPDALRTGWVSSVLFEPSVGNRILHEMAQKEKHLALWKNTGFIDARRTGDGWEVRLDSGGGIKTVRAKILIDATELGDVAKACGAGYDVGMEARSETGEDIAPQYANNIVQDLTYTAVLKDYGRDVTVPRPEGYDPAEFACCCANDQCTNPKEPERMWPKEMMISYGRLPNGKYMINWPIEGNDYYANLVDMSPPEREAALEAAKQRTLRFVYFIRHELGFNTLGLADDEFPTEDRLPLIPYYRESRRIHGLVRFTLNHIADPYGQPEPLYRTCIAVGDYPVDHHHGRYDGAERLPDLHFHAIPSFGLPLGTLIPQGADGLIVAEKSISVSNIVNGTTRLQPVVMQIGQAAGTLAALAVKQNRNPADIAVRDVQNAILDAGGYLLPYIDVKVSDPMFAPLQRIGSTGIMKGVGRSEGWSNRTWFRADTVLIASELTGLAEFYPAAGPVIESKGESVLTLGESMELIGRITGKAEQDVRADTEKIWTGFGFGAIEPGRPVLRGEMAVLLDRLLDPFNARQVDITGKLIR